MSKLDEAKSDGLAWIRGAERGRSAETWHSNNQLHRKTYVPVREL